MDDDQKELRELREAFEEVKRQRWQFHYVREQLERAEERHRDALQVYVEAKGAKP